ncbi:hypothetical protein NQD34_014182 [Periophthalmus magnuspinnatus]|nr:hypothetical protein NQD34_014182 [Periophthalmus magnuspinnatus]
MAPRTNRVGVSSEKKKKKLKKFYPFLSGNTKNAHEVIVGKLKSEGAKRVNSVDKSDVVIVFCPIVSRFETDITAALSEVKAQAERLPKVILVAMHHTYSTDYVVPSKTEHDDNGKSVPVVHFLFHETKGLLKCPHNVHATKTLKERMGFKSRKSKMCTIT